MPETLSLEGKSVPMVRRKNEGFTGTLETRRDWLAFLRDLEVRYYQRMVTFLREKVWALDERGQRQKPLPVTAVGSEAQIRVSGAEGSLWYEVETQVP